MMNVTTMGLDIAKNVFLAHGVDGNGKVVVRKKLTRAKVLEFFVNLPPVWLAWRPVLGRTIGPGN